MTNRPPITHLLAITLALAALAAGAWFYTNANEPVEGIPDVVTTPNEGEAPTDPAACALAGGVWNECASACPPDAEACILMCVQKCEGLGDGMTIVEAYFPNEIENPGAEDCSAVYPVRRAVAPMGAGGPLGGALRALLGGPRDQESQEGYFTSIPEGVSVESIAFADGVMRVDFSEELAAVAGSCRVQSIRAQIERTLMQSGDVKEVVITVDGGDPDEALQP